MAEPIYFENGAPTHAAIEKLLGDIYRSGDWTDDHEDILDQWRAARGDDAKDNWAWWVGEVGCETYSFGPETRDAAIADGRREYGQDGKFEIIEARLWNDDVKEGEETMWFAESRNKEVVIMASNDACPKKPANSNQGHAAEIDGDCA